MCATINEDLISIAQKTFGYCLLLVVLIISNILDWHGNGQCEATRLCLQDEPRKNNNL